MSAIIIVELACTSMQKRRMRGRSLSLRPRTNIRSHVRGRERGKKHEGKTSGTAGVLQAAN